MINTRRVHHREQQMIETYGYIKHHIDLLIICKCISLYLHFAPDDIEMGIIIYRIKLTTDRRPSPLQNADSFDSSYNPIDVLYSGVCRVPVYDICYL